MIGTVEDVTNPYFILMNSVGINARMGKDEEEFERLYLLLAKQSFYQILNKELSEFQELRNLYKIESSEEIINQINRND